MTATEKASYLINLFFNLPSCTSVEEAKYAATICVDEILTNSRSSIPILIPSNELVCSPDYWQQVKNEITEFGTKTI